MNEAQQNKSGRSTQRCWRNLRRTLIALAVIATLVAVFYAEENWRGKRAWENCRRELAAQGEVLDWSAYIPPPVPDDQNFFKAPKMTEWFVRPPWSERSGGNFPSNKTNSWRPPSHPDTASVSTSRNAITNAVAAARYLEWSDQFEPELSLMREALKLPFARIDGDYSRPTEMPLPNFVVIRDVVQILAQRAHCFLLLGMPKEALAQLTMIPALGRVLEGGRTGKPMFLVSAMIDVAITGLYGEMIGEGLRQNAWGEPELLAIQEQLQQINLLPLVASAFKSEPASLCRTLESISPARLSTLLAGVSRNEGWPVGTLVRLMPQGWIFQNIVVVARLQQKWLSGLDLAGNRIFPGGQNQAAREIRKEMGTLSPFKILAAVSVSNFGKVWQTTARNQTLLNEALVACALERYRLEYGNYPKTLNELAPRFITKLPHDIIGGEPLRYRRVAEAGLLDGNNSTANSFVLYSVGWNEKDDGGEVVLDQNEKQALERGDWVWMGR